VGRGEILRSKVTELRQHQGSRPIGRSPDKGPGGVPPGRRAEKIEGIDAGPGALRRQAAFHAGDEWKLLGQDPRAIGIRSHLVDESRGHGVAKYAPGARGISRPHGREDDGQALESHLHRIQSAQRYHACEWAVANAPHQQLIGPATHIRQHRAAGFIGNPRRA
jgi:hypothetical protein